MTNVPGGINSFTGMDFTLFQSRGRVAENNSVSSVSMEAEIIQFSLEVKTGTRQNIGTQDALAQFNRLDPELKSSLTYNGKPIAELSPEQAGALVSEDGYFGVDQTSKRIADFVIMGAGDDMEKLKAGREGVLQGFKQAEDAWGGKLPEISYETLARTLETIDEKIRENGGSVVDLSI
ncbi:MAG: hydrogenase-4 component G [Desulfobacterales bacterium]|nr:hydrogenase-4 component G [Desulfobacterales bacterium]